MVNLCATSSIALLAGHSTGEPSLSPESLVAEAARFRNVESSIVIGIPLVPTLQIGAYLQMDIIALVFTHRVRGSRDRALLDGEWRSNDERLGSLAIALAILLVGPGKISLDAMIFGRHKHADKM